MLKWRTGRVTIGSSAVEVVAARTGRKSLKLYSLPATNNVFFGPDNTVTTSTGVNLVPLSLNGGFDLSTEDAVYGIRASGTTEIGFLETYEE